MIEQQTISSSASPNMNQPSFSDSVRVVMTQVLRRCFENVQTTRRLDIRQKVSKEEFTLLLERHYLVRASGNEQEYFPGLMAFEDFADVDLKDLSKRAAEVVLRALKLLYSKDQARGWSESDIRKECHDQLEVSEDPNIQLGMHLVNELRLGNSVFDNGRYTHVFPLEDIIDFHSIDELWNTKVVNHRQDATSLTTYPTPQARAFIVQDDFADPAGAPNDRNVDSTLDDLLPIYRRKIFDADLKPQKIAGQVPVALLMLDLDHFKQINDIFSHPVGDAVLIACADVVRSVVHLKGKAYRYGGEEFAAILPNFTITEAMATAERIREQITQLKVDGCSREITVSIGVSVCLDSASAEKLVQCADKALYDAKTQGRNRVIAAGNLKSTSREKEPAVASLRLEDRVAAVDLELRIDQGMRQTFVAIVSNKSDEEVSLEKIKITCRKVLVVEHEPKGQKPLLPRKLGSFSWSCNDDPYRKAQQIEGIWDREFETFLDVELFARVLGSLKICNHAIKVKVEPGSYRIWQLP